jgi:hypothetical protein
MNCMAVAPDSTKTSLRQRRLARRARERWPRLGDVTVRHHGAFAYVTGHLPDGTTMPLFRLRYNGSATTWGFAIYRASHDDHENSYLPSGCPSGTRREHSTAPAGSTSTTTPPGCNPRRTNGRDH